ncbi:MAG: glycosyltransferase [Saccharofermentans sp.]|nr:glycosyltransferase [Saccharofermentans sp.]
MNTERFAAVIVTYFPDVERVSNNVSNLIAQGFLVIIVDNGSEKLDAIQNLQSSSCLVKELGENKGIAYALNEGMRIAAESGAAWVLSLDQDSIPGDNIYNEYKKHIDLPEAGALCPLIVRNGKMDLSDDSFETVCQYDVVDTCPTAGFFLNVNDWKSVDGYDDKLFIDYVDYDMCMRLKGIGKKIYRVQSTSVIQELGKIQYNSFCYKLGKVLKIQKLCNFAVTYNHSPKRNYYYVRNGVYYINKYKDLLNVRVERNNMVKWEIKKLVHEGKKYEQFKAILSGIKDAKEMIKEDRA